MTKLQSKFGGKSKRILFLCAHNQSRSVTAEGLLTGERGYEVRSRALWKDMSRKVTKEDGRWADEVFVMMPGMAPVAEEAGVPANKIKSLWIPDAFVACEAALVVALKNQLAEKGIHVNKSVRKASADCEKVYSRKMGFGRINWDWFGSGKVVGGEPWQFGVEGEAVSGHVTRPTMKSMEWLKSKEDFHEPDVESAGYGYIPYWHIGEGMKRQREAKEREEELMRDWRAYQADQDKKQKKLK